MKELGAQLHEEYVSSPSLPSLGLDDIIEVSGFLN